MHGSVRVGRVQAEGRSRLSWGRGGFLVTVSSEPRSDFLRLIHEAAPRQPIMKGEHEGGGKNKAHSGTLMFSLLPLPSHLRTL